MYATLDALRDTLETNLNTTHSAESGTTTTNIKVTAHGLITGDEIINTTRSNTSRTITRVDANNFTVDAITGQTSGDSIKFLKFKKYFVGYVKNIPLNYLPILMVYPQNAEAGRRTTGTDQWQRNIIVEIVTNAYGKINIAEDSDQAMQAQKQLWDLIEEVDANNIFKSTTVLGILQRNLTGSRFLYHTVEGWEYNTEETSGLLTSHAKINIRTVSPFVLRS